MADKDKNESDQKESSSQAEKLTFWPKAVFRLIFGFVAFLLWILFAVPPTLIYSSGIQTFIGTVSFIIRNPLIFLLIALINVFMGVVSYIFLGILLYSAFHILWSIRWFYGYGKYRHVKSASS